MNDEERKRGELEYGLEALWCKLREFRMVEYQRNERVKELERALEEAKANASATQKEREKCQDVLLQGLAGNLAKVELDRGYITATEKNSTIAEMPLETKYGTGPYRFTYVKPQITPEPAKTVQPKEAGPPVAMR